MRKIFFFILLVFSCENATKREIHFIEGNIPNNIFINDFEDPLDKIYTYSGEKSKVIYYYTNNFSPEGKSSLYVKIESLDWAGVLIGLGNQKGDWSGMNYFKMKVYGKNSGETFNITIEDKDSEGFNYELKDNFSGWKEIFIPINEFKQRKDWQNEKAIKNGIIDYPLKNLQFCRTQKANLELFFDDFEAVK